MEKITSIQNKQIKILKKLSQKKYRKELGSFMIENLVIINDALEGGFKFSHLFLTDEFVKRNKEKFEAFQTSDAEIFLVNEKINRYYSELDTPSGITAVYNIFENEIEKGESVVYLNSINDPGNLGTILRTCLAFGFNNVIVDSTCADIYNSKAIQSAKDTIFKLNIKKDEENTWIENTELPIYVTNVHEGTDLENLKHKIPFCLVFGNESHGVSEDIIKLSKENIRISMKGDIESLNVSTAAGIFLYKLRTL